MLPIPNQTWLDPRVEIRTSDVAGQGSFANAPIKAGEIVIRWGGGVIVTDQEFQKGFTEGKYQPETSVHFDKDHKWVHLAAEPDPNDAFLNHSCNPNLWFTDGWAFAAKGDIATGEELTFDYATGETYPLQAECQCGATNCRKNVTGEEWKDPTFQEKYYNHFNPYIQGLIDEQEVYE
jgi:SET domain-containing protein